MVTDLASGGGGTLTASRSPGDPAGCSFVQNCDEGYIKLYRSIRSWAWYRDIPTKVLFLHLLLLANHDDYEVGNVTIKRGQCMASLRDIANDSGLTLRQVRYSLTKLIETKTIEQSGAHYRTLLTICNYDIYQSRPEKNGTSLAHHGHKFDEKMAQVLPSQPVVNSHVEDALVGSVAQRNLESTQKMARIVQEVQEAYIYKGRPSLSEVFTLSEQIGLAKWRAEEWFNEMEGIGWIDYSHRPITNWKSVLMNVQVKWRADGSPASKPGKPVLQPNGNNGVTPERKAIAESIKRRIARI